MSALLSASSSVALSSASLSAVSSLSALLGWGGESTSHSNYPHSGCRSSRGTNTSMDIANHVSNYIKPNAGGAADLVVMENGQREGPVLSGWDEGNMAHKRGGRDSNKPAPSNPVLFCSAICAQHQKNSKEK
jgi:hypothetical protein